MAKLRKTPQPPIDPRTRRSEWRPWWIGAVIAAVAVALYVGGLRAGHEVFLRGGNQSLSQSQLVGAVTANVVQRPVPGAGTAISPSATQPAGAGSGQADCPT